MKDRAVFLDRDGTGYGIKTKESFSGYDYYFEKISGIKAII